MGSRITAATADADADNDTAIDAVQAELAGAAKARQSGLLDYFLFKYYARFIHLFRILIVGPASPPSPSASGLHRPLRLFCH